MENHDFVVVGPGHRCARAEFVVEPGEDGTVPDLNEYPFPGAGVGHTAVGRRMVRGLERMVAGPERSR
jgi:hypothetical protein